MRKAILSLILILTIITSAYYIGANRGWDIGRICGHNDAILEGKIKVECHFPRNPKHAGTCEE